MSRVLGHSIVTDVLKRVPRRRVSPNNLLLKGLAGDAKLFSVETVGLYFVNFSKWPNTTAHTLNFDERNR